MKLFPAIDMKHGQCVRLIQGDFTKETVYATSPAAVAAEWEWQGARFLHLVDLDGALQGCSVNLAAVREICQTVHIPVELGGGVRTAEQIRQLLNAGVSRVILGTKAIEDPEFVKQCVQEFGAEQIVVGIDAKDGMVAISGWETVSEVSAVTLAKQVRDFGIQTIIYTDVAKDGMMQGPNISATVQLAELSGLSVIASGGVSCMEDLERLAEANVYGVVIGKALYEKKICLADAVKAYERD